MITKATKADYKIAQYNVLIKQFESIYEKAEAAMLDPEVETKMEVVIKFLFDLEGRMNELKVLRDKHEDTTEG